MFRSNFINVILLIIFMQISISAGIKTIVVDKNGNGNYKTITKAVQSLPMFNYERVIIHVNEGVYEEKIIIDQDNITLEGDGRNKTFIKYHQLRSDWEKQKDHIGPAVININGDDFIIKDITIENTQPEVGPHAFAVYGKGTRTILLNCDFLSKGGDTVSLWDYKNGMYYMDNCFVQGAVDMFCPRGWCYVNNSRFYELKKTASVWHAGGYNINQKMVIKNSSFDGVKDFELARHHYEAQFYFINCNFSENLADKDIYFVKGIDSSSTRPFNWGKRYYFKNCSRPSGNYHWFKDNVDNEENFTAKWTFDNVWNPEETKGIK